mgnify:CR=1 FL=1
MSDKNLNELLNAIKTNLQRMCDPNHPVYRIVIERDGYGVDKDGNPEVAAFHMKLEHLSAVVHLPVAGRTGLVMPNGAAMRSQMPQQPVVEDVVVASDLERAPDTSPGEAPAL